MGHIKALATGWQIPDNVSPLPPSPKPVIALWIGSLCFLFSLTSGDNLLVIYTHVLAGAVLCGMQGQNTGQQGVSRTSGTT